MHFRSLKKYLLRAKKKMHFGAKKSQYPSLQSPPDPAPGVQGSSISSRPGERPARGGGGAVEDGGPRRGGGAEGLAGD